MPRKKTAIVTTERKGHKKRLLLAEKLQMLSDDIILKGPLQRKKTKIKRLHHNRNKPVSAEKQQSKTEESIRNMLDLGAEETNTERQEIKQSARNQDDNDADKMENDETTHSANEEEVNTDDDKDQCLERDQSDEDKNQSLQKDRSDDDNDDKYDDNDQDLEKDHSDDDNDDTDVGSDQGLAKDHSDDDNDDTDDEIDQRLDRDHSDNDHDHTDDDNEQGLERDHSDDDNDHTDDDNDQNSEKDHSDDDNDDADDDNDQFSERDLSDDDHDHTDDDNDQGSERDHSDEDHNQTGNDNDQGSERDDSDDDHNHTDDDNDQGSERDQSDDDQDLTDDDNDQGSERDHSGVDHDYTDDDNDPISERDQSDDDHNHTDDDNDQGSERDHGDDDHDHTDDDNDQGSEREHSDDDNDDTDGDKDQGLETDQSDDYGDTDHEYHTYEDSENESYQNDRETENKDEKLKADPNEDEDSEMELETGPEKDEDEESFKRKFDIIITKKEWKSIRPKGRNVKLQKYWTHFIAEKFGEHNKRCVLKFNYHKVNVNATKGKSFYFVANAQCKHTDCGLFQMMIEEKPKRKDYIKIHVTTLRAVKKHRYGDKKKRILSGRERIKAQKKLAENTASTVFYSEYGRMSKEELQSGNFTKCQSEEVLRKVKSDWNVHDVLHKDPFTELVICHDIFKEEEEEEGNEKVRGYIQEISYTPLMVVMFSSQSLQLAKESIKNGNGVFYFDATGSLIRKLHVNGKRILYYALVVKHPDAVTVPILEFLSDHHGTYYVVRPLLTLQSQLGKYLRPVRIEVDFSWALIHSVLLAFNCMSVKEYINNCYKVVTEQKTVDFTVVHICCAHMLNSVRKHVKERVKDKALREVVVRMWAVVQNTTDLHKALKVWKIWCSVFCSRHESVSVLRAIQEMNVLIATASSEMVDEILICDEDGDDNGLIEQAKLQKAGIREESPFRPIFQEALLQDSDNNSDEDDQTGKENKYYHPEIVNFLGRNYMPLFPLWSGIILREVHSENTTRDSNAAVESWMKVVKQNILQKEKNMRMGAFVRKLRPIIKGRLKHHLDNRKKRRHGSPNEGIPQRLIVKMQRMRKKGGRRKVKGSKRTSFFYSPPKNLPTPKGKRKKDEGNRKTAFSKRTSGMEDKQRFHTVPGLVNVGNTCWLNATLQGMASLKELNCSGEDDVSRETQEVLSLLRRKSGSIEAIDPVDLRMSIEENLPQFSIGQQHDGAEFLQLVTENVEFGVDIRYRRLCHTCSKEKSKIEHSSVLSAEIPRRNTVSVNDCLDEYCKQETLTGEDAIYCEVCRRKTTQSTSYEIVRVNGGLIILLKRFRLASRGTHVKNRQQIQVNRVLGWKDIGVFRLNAIQCHLGATMSSGHYITFTIDDEWVIRRCDDEYVEVMDAQSLSRQEVMIGSYVLFYGELTRETVQSMLRQSHDAMVSNCRNVGLYATDLLTLNPHSWLNDQVVNAYMALIGSNFRRVSALDVFFFHTLLSGRSPEKFVKKDIFTKEKVLIPALQNSHWTLLVMDMKDTTVWVFDSSENESLIQAHIVRNYMEDLLAEWEQNPSRKYRLKIKKNLPKQTGSSDCGVFMCQFALCVASGTAINFISSDINRFRRKMVFECLSGNLL